MSAHKPRRLDVVARKSLVPAGARHGLDAFDLANAARAREKAAVVAMVRFAQALAGTVIQSPQEVPEKAPPPRAPRAPAVKRPPAERPRPDQHTEVTWDAAMSVPFITPDYGVSYGAVMVEQPAEKLHAKNGFDPWPGQEVLIPSYARKPEEEE